MIGWSSPGPITHEEVLGYYERAHLFVLGCIEARDGDRDGIPNVVAESMAMGVPVAATTVSGVPELVENGRTGLLAPPGDAEAPGPEHARAAHGPGTQGAGGARGAAQGGDRVRQRAPDPGPGGYLPARVRRGPGQLTPRFFSLIFLRACRFVDAASPVALLAGDGLQHSAIGRLHAHSFQYALQAPEPRQTVRGRDHRSGPGGVSSGPGA